MALRGMFDDGACGDMDWFSFHERQSCINALCVSDSDCDSEFLYGEGRSWWDQYRMRNGSPLHQGFDWDGLLDMTRRSLN